MASHPTHHSMKQRGHRDHGSKLHRITSGGPSEATIKKVVKPEIRKAMGEHDSQLHGGKHTRLNLATGGSAPSKKKSKPGNHVNINIIHAGREGAGPGGGPGGLPIPPRPPVPAGPPAVPPPPPGPQGPRPMPGPGAMPGRPMMPPQMPIRNTGGRVTKAAGGLVDAGGKSGVGRLEKAHYESRHHLKEEQALPPEDFEHKKVHHPPRHEKKRGGRNTGRRV